LANFYRQSALYNLLGLFIKNGPGYLLVSFLAILLNWI